MQHPGNLTKGRGNCAGKIPGYVVVRKTLMMSQPLGLWVLQGFIKPTIWERAPEVEKREHMRAVGFRYDDRRFAASVV